MRLLAGLLLAALLLCGLACAALALGQRRFLYPGAFGPQNPWTIPPGLATITVATPDGESLHGLWRPPRPGCGVVVSFHGNGSRPEPHAARFAAGPWRAGGWGVLSVAYRGYPGSTGSPSEDGLIRDGLAAVEAARARAPGAPILLHGHSLGAAVAAAFALVHRVVRARMPSPLRNAANSMQIQLNGEPYELPAGETVADLLARLELTGRRLAVELNRDIVPRSAHASTALSEGDQVEVVHAIGGG
ncbi:sulfur carrier protein ThiS [Methylobacterium organophilum]|nr:sulfur carrier protein ThiS [Methylobacterium organophilum]